MNIDNTESEYYLRFGRKGEDVYTAVDPGFINGPGGWVIAGSVGDGNWAGVAFGFPVQGGDGATLIHYSPATWGQLKWQFTDTDGQFFEVQSGHLAIGLENDMKLISGSLNFKFKDGSEVEGTFRLLKR